MNDFFGFEGSIAMEYGVPEAIMLHNLHFWLKTNKANGTNCHDGNYWTFNTKKAYAELFPFFSPKKIERILDNLRDKGLLIVGNYNKKNFDRTNWYAFTPKAWALFGKDGNGNSFLVDRVRQNDVMENDKMTQQI